VRNLSNIEAHSVLLLAELEKAIIKGEKLNSTIVIQMNELKKAIEAEDQNLGKDLEEMYKKHKNLF
jgi:hypothetical protein